MSNDFNTSALEKYRQNVTGRVTEGIGDNYDMATSVSAFTPVVPAAPVVAAPAFNWRNPTGGISEVSSEFSGSGITTTNKGDGPDPSKKWSLATDGESLQGYAQLGGLAMQLLGYSDQKKHQRAQTAALKQNIAQQKIDNEFRATARSNLNTPMANSNTGIA